MRGLSERYASHHQQRNRIGFTFGGSDRTRLLRDWIGAGRMVLDVGCRDGTLTSEYAEGNAVVGVDVDIHALRLGRSGARLQTALQVDAGSALPFDKESFDVMVCGEVLEHLPFPDLLIQEASRILKPDGLFVGSVPNAFRLKNRLSFLLGRPFDSDPTHLRFFSIARLRELLRVGFADVIIHPMIGRWVGLHPPSFANTLMWRCRKQR